MRLDVGLLQGKIEGFRTTKGAEMALSVRLSLGDQVKEKRAWAAVEALCPGFGHLAKAIAGDEGAGAQHVHCHTPLDPMTVTLHTRESDDPAVDPVLQLTLEDCRAGPKTAILMLDADGECTVAMTLQARVPKAKLKTLADLRGADVFVSLDTPQMELALAPVAA